MRKACIEPGCGRSFEPKDPSQRRCPNHQGSGTGWSHNRDRAAQQRFRDAVLKRDGYRCTYTEHDIRCSESEDLRAAHLIPIVEGGSYHPDNGRTLCREHDRMTDPRAR